MVIPFVWLIKRTHVSRPAGKHSKRSSELKHLCLQTRLRSHRVNLSDRIIIPLDVERWTLLKIMSGNCLLLKSKFSWAMSSPILLTSRWLSYHKIKNEKPLLEIVTGIWWSWCSRREKQLSKLRNAVNSSQDLGTLSSLIWPLWIQAVKVKFGLPGRALPQKRPWILTNKERLREY